MGSTRPIETPARKGRALRCLAFAGIVVISPLFFIGGPDWSDGPLLKSAWNLGHILFFALFTAATQPWRWLTGWRLWALSSLAVLLMGVGIELVQSFGLRQVDAQDLLRNLLGLWFVLAVRAHASFSRPSRLTACSLRLVVASLVVAQASAVGGVALQQYRVSKLLPALYDFSHIDPLTYWNGRVAQADGTTCTGDSQLRFSLSTDRYSGASLHNFPGDWRGYQTLVITLWNPQDHPLILTLRVNDTAHERGDNRYGDRFNTRLQLRPGLNTFNLGLDAIRSAPANRPMGMGTIRRLMLFASALPERETVCLMELRLE